MKSRHEKLRVAAGETGVRYPSAGLRARATGRADAPAVPTQFGIGVSSLVQWQAGTLEVRPGVNRRQKQL